MVSNNFLTQTKKTSKIVEAGHKLNRFGEFSVLQLMRGIGPHAEGRRLSVSLETSMTTQTTDQDCLLTCGQAGEGN